VRGFIVKESSWHHIVGRWVVRWEPVGHGSSGSQVAGRPPVGTVHGIRRSFEMVTAGEMPVSSHPRGGWRGHRGGCRV